MEIWKVIKNIMEIFPALQKSMKIEKGQDRKSSMLTKVRIAFGGHIQEVFFSLMRVFF